MPRGVGTLRPLLVLLLCAAYGECGRTSGGLRTLIVRPPGDTVRFDAPARARRCGSGHGVLVEATARGNGVLAWLRVGQSDSVSAGAYPVIARGDTAALRGAVVSARFVLGDLAVGVSLDSGLVTVTPSDGRLMVRVRGSGLELAGARRVAVDASFAQVAIGADTADCRAQP